MRLHAGTKLGSYEISRPLGAGGMGEVYQAKDSKLKREVAIKVLPDEFSCDADRLARFHREAEVLASLNHPHIAAIHDMEQFGDLRFLVLELVEGETLAERIARGPIPMDEALAVAKQVAEALESAHEAGIIHRDLKPTNLKLTKDGSVKVLDFGLAKVRDPRSNIEDASKSPTVAMLSAPGVILGTAGYMSPEQLKGRESDRTADVWAFGCLLYEMLVGQPVFDGETISEILAGVLKAEPDWKRLPPDTPPIIRRLLKRCLEKDRKRRFHHMGDVRLEIEDVQNTPQVDAPAVVPASRVRERLAWIVTLAALAAGGIAVWQFRAGPPAFEMRFEIVTPSTSDPESLAISPDGQRIAFVATSDGRPRLWVRGLGSVAARPLAGTDLASHPFWSPDSRSLGFFADGRLKRVDVDGGLLQTLANASNARGGAWNTDGVILFAPTATGSIFRVPASGGQPEELTRVDRPQQTSHRFPQFLPDNRHFIYYVQGAPEGRGVYVAQLDGGPVRRLLDADAAAVFAPPDRLLFARQGTLLAQRFDPDGLEILGNPSPVVEQVLIDSVANVAAVSAGAGLIAYRTGTADGGQRQFVWFDRSGAETGKVGEPDASAARNIAGSPDGRHVALQRTVNGNTDIWLLDAARSVLSRFTFDPASESHPVWSPDGRSIVWQSNLKGAYDLYRKPLAAAGPGELLFGSNQNKAPSDWSSDGKFLLYRNQDPQLGLDILALPMNGDQKPFPVVQTNFEERDAQFSPDGHWIAYQSNESGRVEIYVQPFRGGGRKFQISTNGGAQVRWRRDGKELFYIALDGRLMAVPVRIGQNGQSFEAEASVPLFATRVGGAVQSNFSQQYIVSRDGQRFLMNAIASEPNTSPITVILNWDERR